MYVFQVTMSLNDNRKSWGQFEEVVKRMQDHTGHGMNLDDRINSPLSLRDRIFKVSEKLVNEMP